MTRRSKRILICQTGMMSTTVLDILHISIPPYIKTIMYTWIEISQFSFLSIVFDWSRLKEGFFAICFGWYCPYWREFVTVLGMYIFTTLWLIIILCQNNVSDWEDFNPSATMVIFRWDSKGIACGVWVLQRWGNIQYT